MNFGLLFEISLGLLRARFKQSLVAAIGVTFSIMMFITLISFMNGLNQLLDGLIINRTPHIRIYNEIKPSEIQPIELDKAYQNQKHFISSIKPKDKGKEIYNSAAIIHSLKQDPRVFGVAPKINTSVFYTSGSIELPGLINGVDVIAEQRLFALSDNVIKGNAARLAEINNSI